MASEDITFCANKSCTSMKCDRNQKHITEIVELWLNGLKGTPQPRDQLYDIINRIEEQPGVDAVELDSVDSLATHCRYCGAKMDGGNEDG